jgi:hypothetical protein
VSTSIEALVQLLELCAPPTLKHENLRNVQSSLWPAYFWLFVWLDFGPCPLFLFLSLSWVLSFYKGWQGFII